MRLLRQIRFWPWYNNRISDVIFSVSNFKQLMGKVGMRSYSIRSGKFGDIGSYSVI